MMMLLIPVGIVVFLFGIIGVTVMVCNEKHAAQINLLTHKNHLLQQQVTALRKYPIERPVINKKIGTD